MHIQYTNASETIHPPSPIPAGPCPLCQKKVEGKGWFEITTLLPDDSAEIHCAHPDCVWEKVKGVNSLSVDFEEIFDKVGDSIVKEVKAKGGKTDEHGFHKSTLSKTVTLISEIFYPITLIISAIFNLCVFLSQLGKGKVKPYHHLMKIPVKGNRSIDNVFITITESNTTLGYNKGKKFAVVAQN